METRRIGVILNGVTGRMGTNQHLVRSILAIIARGGVRVGDDVVLLPDPLLTGRNANKLRHLAETLGPEHVGRPLKWTTDLPGALAGAEGEYEIFFDASSTQLRKTFVEQAAQAGKSIYCEKPTATDTATALKLAETVEAAGLKNGVVQDKLWLPGLRKLAALKQQGFFGKILSVQAEFGYWVFTGDVPDQPIQRPSWNYRAEDGGGMMIDMFCHWRYVIDNLFGPIARLVAHGNTLLSERVDENAKAYPATADDAAWAIFVLEDGTVCQFNSSWGTRVRRDDLLTVQVDGSAGSAVAGLRDCWVQPLAATPRCVWNPDIPNPVDFRAGWTKVPDTCEYDNAFKAQWELFLRHVALDEPFLWSLREGAKGVQLADLGLQSWRDGAWKDVPAL
jgi:predicted dehydrogenase